MAYSWQRRLRRRQRKYFPSCHPPEDGAYDCGLMVGNGLFKWLAKMLAPTIKKT